MKKQLNEICDKMVEVMHDIYNEPEMDSRMRIALFLAAQESIAKNMERLRDKDIEDYVYCATVLKLYQLLARQAQRKYPIDWGNILYDVMIKGVDFVYVGGIHYTKMKHIALSSCYFYRKEDLLQALEVCGIDAEFQTECARFGLGGA